MREIKFRAWCDETKKMYPVNMMSFWVSKDKEFSGIDVQVLDKDETELFGEMDLMQYTGLHDKNGKEGYFDDLVRWGGSVYQVVWNKAEGITQLIKCSGFEVFATLPIKEMERGEIMGDIYSNPELLEVKCKE